MQMLDTEFGLRFGKSKIVMTHAGEREVRSADVTEDFWAAWRERKEEVKACGYSVGKSPSGAWKVSLWRETAPQEKRQQAVEASRAEDAVVDIPVPAGRALLPYQRAGVAYCLGRPGTLLADEMGLGKSPQSICVANTTGAKRVLVICPASLLGNWRNEINRWQTGGHPVHVVRAGDRWPRDLDAGWVVINYDIVSRYPAIKLESWDVMIVDESHYLKNPKAKRTMWILGGGRGEDRVEPIRAARTLLLTGTPITNRPSEIFGLIRFLDPKRWTSFNAFAKRYCGAHFDGYGMKMGEPAHLDELQTRLRETVMVRRIKADVLTDLPAKQRQIVLVDIDGADAIIAAERAAESSTEEALAAATYAAQKAEAEGSEAEYKEAVAKLRSIQATEFSEIARIRHETALAKLPAVIEHLQNTAGKVVVFAHHRDVVAGLIEALREDGVVSITGDTPNDRRTEIVERFQTDPNIRFFVGNMQAAGVGITLTAASHVVFAELDWVPATLSQAEDRCHRIGQRASVLVQHLVVDGSIDARMAATVVAKQEVIDRALDARVDAIEYPSYVAPEAVPVAPEREDARVVAPESIVLTTDQVQAVHQALRAVANLDADGAQALNGIGFSKADTQFGRELAQRIQLSPRQAWAARKMIRKYRRQYSDDLYQRMFLEAQS